VAGSPPLGVHFRELRLDGQASRPPGFGPELENSKVVSTTSAVYAATQTFCLFFSERRCSVIGAPPPASMPVVPSRAL
jgi:hypothetical protein